MIEPNHWTNLLWSLGTPSIARGCGLPWLPQERQSSLATFFSQTEIRRRLQPKLEEFLAKNTRSRLGVYFEDLWAFAFSHHPDYELRQRNLALRDGGHTLGELDFVVHYLPADTTEHWEVAVKFYLQVGNQYWVGPGLRDRLDLKLAHMRDHQLPVIKQTAAAELLRDKNIHIDQQWTLMPGRLFRPLESLIHPDQGNGWWATQSEFRQQFSHEPLHWALLPKRAWLASDGHRVGRGVSCESLTDQFSKEELHSPFCVAGIAGGQEQSRGFIVPDNWYQSALDCTP
jgi:hypothetical protein